MYDTVRIASPWITPELAKTLISKCYTHQTMNMETGEIALTGKPATLYGEYGNTISISIPSVRWIRDTANSPSKQPSNPRIILEASVHKVLVGHNIYGGPKDIKASIAYLVGKVEQILDVKLPPAMEWEVERVDIANVFLMDNPEQIEAWFHGLQWACFPRRQGKITRYDWGGLYIHGGTTTINIYHKGPELKYKDKDCKRLKQILLPDNHSVDPLKLADNIIKAEIQVRKRKLEYDYKKNPLVRDLTDDYFDKLWAREIWKLMKEAGADMRIIRNHEAVRTFLQKNFTLDKANAMEAFWLKLCIDGEAKVKKSMRGKLSTYNNYRKVLIDNGISWICNDLLFPNYSIVPSDFTLVRGNKYHYDVDLPEIEQKLQPYLQDLAFKRTPAVTIEMAAGELAVSKRYVHRLIKQNAIKSFIYNTIRLIIMDDMFQELKKHLAEWLSLKQGELDFD